MVVAAYCSTAALLATVCMLLVFPVTDRVRIAAVIGHGVIQGLSSSVAFVYMWQCLKRGTTLDGRARALKLTFTVGPIAAVGGSLGAQFVLNHGIPAFEYPYDFAFLESEAQREALSGFVLGVIAARFGIRGPLITTVCLLGLAAVWPLLAPGYTYLLAFGLMGAGELGGAYFPNYVVAFSPHAAAAVNLSLLNLVNPASSVGPVLHGALTERHGFSASFTLGALAAVASLLLVFRLPSGPAPGAAILVRKLGVAYRVSAVRKLPALRGWRRCR